MSIGIDIAEAAMTNDLARLQVLSHNLANAVTAGYRRDVAVNELPALDSMDFSERLSLERDALVPTVTTMTVNEPGTLSFTGNPLDLAIEGDAFFVVAGASGEAFTRDGSFQLARNGALVTAAGMPVLGLEGPIQITTPTPRIDREGRIWDGDQYVAQLRLASFRAPQLLQKMGQGLFRSPAEAAIQSSDAAVRQSHFENSNVQSSQDMVRLLQLTRHFETAQKVITGYDQMLNAAISRIVDF